MENKFHVQIIIRNGAMELWKQKHKISKIRQRRKRKQKTKKKLTKTNKKAAKKWKRRYQKRIKTFGKLRQKN